MTLELPFAALMAWFDGQDIRCATADQGSTTTLPDSTSRWVGPATSADLPRALTWLATEEARGLGCGVVLGGAEITDEVVRRLAPGAVRSLALLECPNVTTKAMAHIAGLELSELALVGCAGVSSGLQPTDPQRVIRLWLADCPRFTARTLKCLHRWQALELLDLRGGVASAALLRWLTPLSRLAHLDVSRAEGGSGLGAGLRALEQLPALRTLALRNARIDDGLLRQLGKLRPLRALDLSGGKVAAASAGWRRLKRVQHLRLRHLCGRSDWWQGIGELAELGDLKSLDLRGNALPLATLDQLRGALAGASLLHDPPHSWWPSMAGPAAPASTPIVSSAPPRPSSAPPQPSVASTPVSPTPPPSPPATPAGTASPSLPAEVEWPRIQDLHVVVPDERGNPCGFTKRGDLAALVDSLDPTSALAALDPDQSCARVLSALGLLVELVQRRDPRGGQLAPAALDRARSLFGDRRSETWSWGASGQGTAFVVGPTAMSCAIELLRWRRRAHPAVDRERDLLRELTRSALLVDHGALHLLLSYLIEHRRDPEIEQQLRLFVGWIEAAVRDAALPARLRLDALQTLERLDQRMPMPERAESRAAISRCLDLLEAAIADESADAWLRRAARLKVVAAAPERLAALRRSGAVPTREVPAPEELTGPGGRIDATRALMAAAEVEASAVLEALRSPELPRAIAALILAPHVGSTDEARELGQAMAALVGRYERHTFGEAGHTSDRLGDLAAERLLAVIGGRRLEGRPLLSAAIDAGLAHPVGEQTPPPGLLAVVSAVEHDAEGQASIRERFADRERGAEGRFALYLTCSSLRREVGLGPLLDDSEDPELRALIGTMGSCLQQELAALADTSTLPWSARRVLPVSQPVEKVPREWLLETLRTARHPIPTRWAILGLVSRLLPLEGTHEELASGASALRGLDVEPPLREIVDDPDPTRAIGRHAAVRWLAVLGDPRDEARLARYMVDHGVWYSLERLPTLVIGLDRLMAACSSENIADDAESELAPLVRLGFGEEQCARIEAKAFVLLARRHLAADHVQMAARAAIYAARLDPCNLEALRLARPER